MSNEIKEILDYLKDDKWDFYPSDGTPYKVFFMEERDKLLDYITNLQRRTEYLERSNNRREDEILSLRDENVEIETLRQEKEDYKSRVEKAVDYIKEQDMSYYGAVVETKMDIILTLLQRGKDE